MLYLLLSVLRTLSTHHHNIVVVIYEFIFLCTRKHFYHFISTEILQFFGFGEEKC